MSLLRPFLLLCACLTLLAPLHAQGPTRSDDFRWTMTVADLGVVTAPIIGTGGWTQGPNGLSYRSVPSFSGDPTYEIIVRAPYSGHPLLPERMLIQIPANFNTQPFHNRAVVYGFHKFSVSEKDIFLNTDLPFEARDRGWMLVAPYGLNETNFANPQCQASLQTIAHALFGLVPFNYRRVYGVGFSMGGLGALSFAMRHLDPLQLQFAGVIVHTATLDMVQTFENSSSTMQIILANSKHYGGNPTSAPFEYDRVSPVRFLSNGWVDASTAPVVNFENRGIYLHSNLADPNTHLVEGMASMSQFLQQRGAIVKEDLVHDPALGHDWRTMDMNAALNFIAPFELENTPPTNQEFFVDNPGRWLHVQVESISPNRHGRFRLELAPFQLGTLNSFALEGTLDLDEISLSLPKLGLTSQQLLRFSHSTGDASYDWIVLEGVEAQPSSILVDGGPPATWSYSATLQELRIVPSAVGGRVTVDILP